MQLPNPEGLSVVFIPGLTSGRASSECVQFENYCLEKRYNFLTYDPRGIGESSMSFGDCNMSHWVADACNMIELLGERCGTAPLVLGTSMGSALATHIAHKKLCRFHALILLCPAINYGDTFVSQCEYLMTSEQAVAFKNGDVVEIDFGSQEDWEPFEFSSRLVESFKAVEIPGIKEVIQGNYPVRILQGYNDVTIPYTWLERWNPNVVFETSDLSVSYLKGCDHLVMNNPLGFSMVKNLLREFMGY